MKDIILGCASGRAEGIENKEGYGGLGENQRPEKNLGHQLSQQHIRSKQRECVNSKKKKVECWQLPEIQKLFTLYAQYGSQWRLMEAQLEHRPSNSIKNRFYTVVRAFLKQLFHCHPQIQNKTLHEIPSKIILKFYEGRNEFFKYKGFGKKVLKAINYDIESQQLIKIGKTKLQQIKNIYDLIYTKSSESGQKPTNSHPDELASPESAASLKITENIEDAQNKKCQEIQEFHNQISNTDLLPAWEEHNHGGQVCEFPQGKYQNFIYLTSNIILNFGAPCLFMII